MMSSIHMLYDTLECIGVKPISDNEVDKNLDNSQELCRTEHKMKIESFRWMFCERLNDVGR